MTTMPEAKSNGVPTEAAESAEVVKPNRVDSQRDMKRRAQESRESALERAFGNARYDDDDLVGDEAPEAEPSEKESVESKAESSPVVPQGVPAEVVAKLQRDIEALQQSLAEERSRQAVPQDPDDGFEIEIPEGWDGISGTLQAVGDRAENTRLIAKEAQKQAQENLTGMLQLRAEVDLTRFASRHPDFWNISDSIADAATTEGLDLYDYKSLQVVYDLVKGRAAVAELAKREVKNAAVETAAAKAGAAPRFRSTQAQTRDESVSPAGRLLSFDEAWNKGLAKVVRSARRSQ